MTTAERSTADGSATERSTTERSTAALIGWTALSVVLPGAAHVRAGWRRTGFALLGAYLVIVSWSALLGLTADAALAGRALNWLDQIAAVALIAAAAWFALVLHSFLVLRPGTPSRVGQLVGGVAAGILSITVLVPFTLAARYVAVSERTIDRVFTAPAEPVPPGDPWGGRDRLNVLLLGGDWGSDRIGMRTDSINVASVDVHTGKTVLLGLPRNLEHVRFPPGSPMNLHFPDGFRLPESQPGWREDLLFSVWQYANEHPELFGGREHMGAETLKETIGYTLGLKIDWYTLVNIWGFAKIIDALGGLVLTVDHDIVFGKYNEGVVRAGTRRLNGADALWFARSRTFSDDFGRMRRQRCVFSALLDQADPATVLTRFNDVAAATRRMVRTDIPRPMLEHLVPLAMKAKHADVTSVQFMPPLISTSYPDWSAIRRLTAKAIHHSVAPATRGPRKHATASTPTTGTTGTTGTAASPLNEGCGAV